MSQLPEGVGLCLNPECRAVYRLPFMSEVLDRWCPICREGIVAHIGEVDRHVDPMILAFQLMCKVHA